MWCAFLSVVLFLLIAAPAPAQWFGGGGGKRYDRASWSLCVGTNCAAASDVTNSWIAVYKLKFEKCFAAAKTGPVGAALVFDIKVNGTSIFGAGSKLQIANGATSGTVATFAAAAVTEGSLVTLDITQVGTTTPGQAVSVSCRLGL